MEVITRIRLLLVTACIKRELKEITPFLLAHEGPTAVVKEQILRSAVQERINHQWDKVCVSRAQSVTFAPTLA